MPKPNINVARLHSSAIVYFDAVRKHKSMRAAARALNVASPAVNRQILKVEDMLGMPVFDRLPGGLQLTAAGEAFARHARNVMQDAARTSAELDALMGVRRGRIAITAVEGVVLGLLPRLIEAFSARHRAIEFDVNAQGSTLMPEALLRGDADLAFGFDLGQREDLVAITSAEFEIGAIVGRNHTLATRKGVWLDNCFGYPIVLAKEGLALHHLMEPIVRAQASAKHPVLRTNSIEMMKQMIGSDSHVMFATALGCEDEIASGQLIHLPILDNGGIRARLGLYARAGHILPPAALQFSRDCETAMRELSQSLSQVPSENP